MQELRRGLWFLRESASPGHRRSPAPLL